MKDNNFSSDHRSIWDLFFKSYDWHKTVIAAGATPILVGKDILRIKKKGAKLAGPSFVVLYVHANKRETLGKLQASFDLLRQCLHPWMDHGHGRVYEYQEYGFHDHNITLSLRSVSVARPSWPVSVGCPASLSEEAPKGGITATFQVWGYEVQQTHLVYGISPQEDKLRLAKDPSEVSDACAIVVRGIQIWNDQDTVMVFAKHFVEKRLIWGYEGVWKYDESGVKRGEKFKGLYLTEENKERIQKRKDDIVRKRPRDLNCDVCKKKGLQPPDYLL